MFEGSLIESRGLVVSGTKRWTTFGSAVFQFGVAGLIVAFPLMHPQALPIFSDAPRLVAPLPVKPPPPIRVEPAASSSTAMSVPSASPAPAAAPRVRSFLSGNIADPGPEPVMTGIPMGSGMPNGLLAVIGTSGPGLNVSVAPAKTIGPTRISSGVSSGMLLSPIQPVYPVIAKAAGVQGVVVMEAVISKTGKIESLHAVSGPPMLRNAALEAVQAARYQPYRLNGEATEVQTTITVVFRLGS
jgi:periplasmic protein TonB